jgi:hypothetical protein
VADPLAQEDLRITPFEGLTMHQIRHSAWIIILLLGSRFLSSAQQNEKAKDASAIDVTGF